MATKVIYQNAPTSLDLSKIKNKLNSIKFMVNWKMNVVLPKDILENFEFDNYCTIIEKSLIKFWRDYQNNCPLEIDQIWYKFESNKQISHQFKILGFEFIPIDQRKYYDNNNDKKNASIKIFAKIECNSAQKQRMLSEDPLTLSLSGSFTRNKRNNTLISIVFKSLMVDDGVVVKPIMEV